ncbi:MAG TPA: hypothetical protein VLB44_14385 [Kofleriaceae bacterium]|nr:hypothetical protein [Kofleriaceae bacterium]
MLSALPYILLAAVVGVGLLGFVAICSVQWKAFGRYRAERQRRKAYAERMAKVDRIGAAPYQPTERPLAAPVPLARGELTSVFQVLEEGTRFGKIAQPPPIPPRARMARGSAPPPMSTQPASRPQPPSPAPAMRTQRAAPAPSFAGLPVVRPTRSR